MGEGVVLWQGGRAVEYHVSFCFGFISVLGRGSANWREGDVRAALVARMRMRRARRAKRRGLNGGRSTIVLDLI